MNSPVRLDVDHRLAFLHRAHARLILFEAGIMDIDEAFDGLVADLECDCTREYFNQLSAESHFHE